MPDVEVKMLGNNHFALCNLHFALCNTSSFSVSSVSLVN